MPFEADVEAMQKPVTICLIRHGPRFLDSDNLAYAFKPVRDGIAEALWPRKTAATQDSHADVIWEYAQVKNKLRFIEVQIYSADRKESVGDPHSSPCSGLFLKGDV